MFYLKCIFMRLSLRLMKRIDSWDNKTNAIISLFLVGVLLSFCLMCLFMTLVKLAFGFSWTKLLVPCFLVSIVFVLRVALEISRENLIHNYERSKRKSITTEGWLGD